MAKDFSNWFYHTDEWKYTRAAYISFVGGMCERCMKEYREGTRKLKNVQPIRIVHHKKYLTPENISNPKIRSSFDNLEGLCDDHHNKEHKARPKRYTFDKNGRPIEQK